MSGGFWRSEEIEGGHPGEVRRLRGVMPGGRRPPAREANVPAPHTEFQIIGVEQICRTR